MNIKSICIKSINKAAGATPAYESYTPLCPLFPSPPLSNLPRFLPHLNPHSTDLRFKLPRITLKITMPAFFPPLVTSGLLLTYLA